MSEVMVADSIEAGREPHLKSRLREELDAGIAVARDPENADLPKEAVRTTTMYSPWYVRTCPQCKQKFRAGDRVRLCPLCERAYHEDNVYRLDCWREHFAGGKACRAPRFDPITSVDDPGCRYSSPEGHAAAAAAESGAEQAASVRPVARSAQTVSQFLRGLEECWKPYGEQPVVVVEDDSPLIGYSCPWCRFNVRAGDRVVRCPCGKCNAHFHDDIYRHLTCWNDWKYGASGNDYCPITGEKIETPPSQGNE
ncbi:MAG: hypothetical protein ABW208_20825 [Pyrinomonadaceae bacterium]